jgi:hypothetical protein
MSHHNNTGWRVQIMKRHRIQISPASRKKKVPTLNHKNTRSKNCHLSEAVVRCMCHGSGTANSSFECWFGKYRGVTWTPNGHAPEDSLFGTAILKLWTINDSVHGAEVFLGIFKTLSCWGNSLLSVDKTRRRIIVLTRARHRECKMGSESDTTGWVKTKLQLIQVAMDDTDLTWFLWSNRDKWRLGSGRRRQLI